MDSLHMVGVGVIETCEKWASKERHSVYTLTLFLAVKLRLGRFIDG